MVAIYRYACLQSIICLYTVIDQLNTHVIVLCIMHILGNDMRRCDVMNQKETPDKLIDEKCGDRVQEGHAGLCV